MDYIILHTKDQLELANAVNVKMKIGYVPQGGVCVTCTDSGIPSRWIQAMVRRKPEPKVKQGEGD